MHLNDSQVSRIARRHLDDLRQRIDNIRSAARTNDNDVLPLTVDALREWGWCRLRDAHHATSHTRAVKITPAAVTTATAASPIASTAFKPGEPEEASLRSRAIRNSGKVTLMAISMPPTM